MKNCDRQEWGMGSRHEHCSKSEQSEARTAGLRREL